MRDRLVLSRRGLVGVRSSGEAVDIGLGTDLVVDIGLGIDFAVGLERGSGL